ncbi:MAG: undecaprenyldiphospho-muramoylpentapeptide beta-N-acetylglucosaminyltransferase [Syntrophomonadaceae bacterium]|nr:undecaprenyldiphospho-muramoylpentapeptide beta-N-acetylglucosaminyltransferase [Syntrophomonadaceae bacterium]MDD3888772.1 undecaprenyldiphospho-muramoylpentapeptide beta-N-acetylglucosaminyltransferase [Syntrophomonadaceae bacterium]MDD4548197.1 undecaprenyldiphospho-muramoylpentapeptide beta-N-acetylglucosaminyltransferase [Syntrophomonadaceae bacterium]
MKVIISGGGTGGHIYPALAIARGIKERLPDTEVLYVGTRKGMESTIVPANGFQFKSIDITGLDRSSIIKASKSMLKFPGSIFQAWNIIRDFQPDIIVGTGGYVSFPVLFAGTFFPCKTFIHEQNAMPGITNRNLAKRVDCTMLTFEEAAPYLHARRIIVTGLPVRKEILEVNRIEARKKLGFDNDNGFTLVAFGGSRGAMSINRAMLGLMARYHREKMNIVWVTGEKNYNSVKEELGQYIDFKALKCQLKLLPYMHNMEEALAVADLVVCRAGASTLSELAVLGLPAILIPYPYAAENHQEKNARALLGKKAAEMVIDEFLDGDTLYNKIETLRKDQLLLKSMSENIRREARPKALDDILDVILN